MAKDAHLLELMMKNCNGEITVEETNELSALIHEGQASVTEWKKQQKKEAVVERKREREREREKEREHKQKEIAQVKAKAQAKMEEESNTMEVDGAGATDDNDNGISGSGDTSAAESDGRKT